MVPVCKPQDSVELALIESALEAHGIPYFVHNKGFGGLYPGPQIDLYNVRTVMVPESAVEAAREVLAALFSSSERSGVEEPPQSSTWDKIRVVAEALLGGWFVPRSKRR
jgi:hypothetical protein